jgi:dipeptidyl aminopeptidase/acylaminoacyl peptidase
VPRAPRPDDLYRLRIATEPRLAPDGRSAVVTLQTVAPGYDGYRQALWLVPIAPRGAARQLTLGARNDRHPRFSPDGRILAFISDRRSIVEEEPGAPDAKDREDAAQVHLLPLDGGEARPDRPASRRDRLRVVARRETARRRERLARRDPRRG